MLGSAILAAAVDAHHTIYGPTHDELDLLDPAAGRLFIERLRPDPPDVVINCAGISNPDFVDSKTDLLTCNLIRPLEFANTCGLRGIKYVHIRSAFEGKECDDDYHYSKTAAYHALKCIDRGHIYYIMPGWIFGKDPKKRVGHKLIDAAISGKDFKATNDRYMTPTYAKDLAEGILVLSEWAAPGEYTLANSGKATFADLAKIAWDFFRAKGILAGVRSTDKIQRPKDATVGGSMRPWQDAWLEYLAGVEIRGSP